MSTEPGLRSPTRNLLLPREEVDKKGSTERLPGWVFLTALEEKRRGEFVVQARDRQKRCNNEDSSRGSDNEEFKMPEKFWPGVPQHELGRVFRSEDSVWAGPAELLSVGKGSAKNKKGRSNWRFSLGISPG